MKWKGSWKRCRWMMKHGFFNLRRATLYTSYFIVSGKILQNVQLLSNFLGDMYQKLPKRVRFNHSRVCDTSFCPMLFNSYSQTKTVSFIPLIFGMYVEIKNRKRISKFFSWRKNHFSLTLNLKNEEIFNRRNLRLMLQLIEIWLMSWKNYYCWIINYYCNSILN